MPAWISAAQRVGKFDQKAVAGGFDDPPPMLANFQIDNGFSDDLEPGQGAFFITAHQPAIAGDVRRQNSRQSSLYARVGQ
jgi:hypothetical protein